MALKGDLWSLGTGYDSESVYNIISDLQFLKDNGVCDRLFYIFENWEEPIDISSSTRKELDHISRLLTHVKSNYLLPENGNVFSSSIDYFSFYNFYRFLELIYSMNLGRPLLEDDVKAIFSSNILEKIILGLKNFDKVHSTKNFNDSFFYYVNDVEWTDKHAEKFFDNLHELIISKYFTEDGNRKVSFKRELKRIVYFLIVCSTVNNKRRYITTIDVTSAYKALIKIIGTDITYFVNKGEYNGLLTCPKCNGYYRLQEDEIPDDFVRCSCGGFLVYATSLEEVKYYLNNFKELIVDERGLVAGAITSLTLALIFNNVYLLTLMSGFITVLLAKNYTNGFKYGFLTGNISGSLFAIAVFLSAMILSGMKLKNMSSIDESTIFMFVLVLGVLAIYCGRISTFLVKPKNQPITSIS
ncbi:MAG: hypothetical protein QMD61_04420 [Methanobacterium sp.]|nr:hypothetical protein [Methanobacterium sp.]